jgi:hypothetical protein
LGSKGSRLLGAIVASVHTPALTHVWPGRQVVIPTHSCSKSMWRNREWSCKKLVMTVRDTMTLFASRPSTWIVTVAPVPDGASVIRLGKLTWFGSVPRLYTWSRTAPSKLLEEMVRDKVSICEGNGMLVPISRTISVAGLVFLQAAPSVAKPKSSSRAEFRLFIIRAP